MTIEIAVAQFEWLHTLSKMEFHYFEGLDHSLNIGLYFIKGEMPAGHQTIFEFINNQTAYKMKR